MVNDLTSEGANNEEEYLAKAHMKAGKKTGEKKGHSVKNNYGSTQGTDNKVYSDRGMKDPDDARLSKQSLPNTRMYSYLE